MTIVPLIAQIILEGMKFIKEERRRALEKEHLDVLEELNNAANAKFPSYTDIDLALAKQRLDTFYAVYLNELKLSQSERAK